MATSGINIKQTLKVKDIKDALRMNGGNVRQTSRYLNVNKDVIYDFINENPELKDYLDYCRSHGDVELLDGSFASLMYNLDRLEKNPKLAFDSAKYVIDKIGHKRGWNNQKSDLEETNSLIKSLSEDIKKSNHTVVEE